MRHLLAALLAAFLSSCLIPTGANAERAQRQLAAAAESTGDVLAIAQDDAPELVPALQAIEDALRNAQERLEAEGRLDTLSTALALVESAILLAADQPRIALALVAVKGALLQLEAAQ